MKFHETPLNGACIIEMDKIEDERGFFARAWCQTEFLQHGIIPDLVQCNVSFNPKRNTLRGLHYQVKPHEEAKLVRCTQGAIYDVIVDLRPESPSFKRWFAVELTARNHRSLYIPGGCAHGFQTLVDNTEVFYQMSTVYCPEAARGLRWNDPLFQIEWPPCAARLVSDRDRNYPDFVP